MGIDLVAGGRNKRTKRVAPKFDDVYLNLLFKLYRFWIVIVVLRRTKSKTNRPPLSMRHLSNFMKGKKICCRRTWSCYSAGGDGAAGRQGQHVKHIKLVMLLLVLGRGDGGSSCSGGRWRGEVAFFGAPYGKQIHHQSHLPTPLRFRAPTRKIMAWETTVPRLSLSRSFSMSYFTLPIIELTFGPVQPAAGFTLD